MIDLKQKFSDLIFHCGLYILYVLPGYHITLQLLARNLQTEMSRSQSMSVNILWKIKSNYGLTVFF